MSQFLYQTVCEYISLYFLTVITKYTFLKVLTSIVKALYINIFLHNNAFDKSISLATMQIICTSFFKEIMFQLTCIIFMLHINSTMKQTNAPLLVSFFRRTICLNKS